MAKAKFGDNTDYTPQLPEWGEGETQVIDNQTCVFIPSPFPQYPGGVWVPFELSARQFDAWRTSVLERAERDADKGNPSIFDYWENRYKFVKKWELDGVTPDMITPDGKDMPSASIVAWIGTIGSELIIKASSFPN